MQSIGNTYKDNQYCAIDIETQSSFRSGFFLPRESGHPADPDQRDTIIELGCDITDGTGCFTTDEGPVAIAVFNGGIVDIRNADVGGEMESIASSSFRVDGDATVQGNINNNFNSLVRLRDRSNLGDRVVTFVGSLSCSNGSRVFFSNVQCGQTCSGAIPGSCTP